MSFEQKIDKILKTNALGINYPSALEEYLGLGTGTITKPLGNGKSPGKGTIKKIIEKLRINQDWWETGKGEIYANQINDRSSSHKEPVKVLPMDAWVLLEDDNRTFKSEIRELWDMVKFLRGQSVKPHE